MATELRDQKTGKFQPGHNPSTDEGRVKSNETKALKAAVKRTSLKEIEEIAKTDPIKAFCLQVWHDTCTSLKSKHSEKTEAANQILQHTRGKPVQRSEVHGLQKTVVLVKDIRGNGDGRSLPAS